MIIIAETPSHGVQCQVRAELSCHCHLSYSRQLLPRNYPGSHPHQSQVRLIFQLLYFNNSSCQESPDLPVLWSVR